METTEILEKTGLNEKEANIYLALLELGTASVASIANKAGIKRPTTYLILDDLQRKGLVSIVPREKKALYTAESPEKLLGEIHKKEELLKRSMPNLLAFYNAKKEKPEVLLFEGKEGIKEVYDKILTARSINFFATIRDFINFYPEFADNLKLKARQGQVVVKEILSISPSDISYAKTVKQNQFYEQRFAKPEMDFLTDNVIFDQSIAFFSYKPYIFAVLMNSREVSQSLKTLFDLAWQSAEPYEKVVGKTA